MLDTIRPTMDPGASASRRLIRGNPRSGRAPSICWNPPCRLQRRSGVRRGRPDVRGAPVVLAVPGLSYSLLGGGAASGKRVVLAEPLAHEGSWSYDLSILCQARPGTNAAGDFGRKSVRVERE